MPLSHVVTLAYWSFSRFYFQSRIWIFLCHTSNKMSFPNKKWGSTAPLWPLSAPQMIDCLSLLCTLPLSFLIFSLICISSISSLSTLLYFILSLCFFVRKNKLWRTQQVDKMIYFLKQCLNFTWNCSENGQFFDLTLFCGLFEA